MMRINVIKVMSKGSDSQGVETMCWMAYTYNSKKSM